MSLKHLSEYRDAELCRRLAQRIGQKSRRPLRLMEVCGTHTVSIFRHGLRALLPDTISLLSGPGCPVCVTAQGEIDWFLALSRRPGVIIVTFGDLLRVPGSGASLMAQRAQGARVKVVDSSLAALQLAQDNPDQEVVFLGVGFETTAPTVAAAILEAERRGLKNFSVACAHKLMPPALCALLSGGKVRLDGLICPGHVSVIIGANAYTPVARDFSLPCVIAGFEPGDILQAIEMLVDQAEAGISQVQIAYGRAVTAGGNPKALALMDQVFVPVDAAWRGLGVIPQSGLKIREKYAAFDAGLRFNLAASEAPEPPGCSCGRVLSGLITPGQCPLFGKTCTPQSPVGPCMVSSEGACAAYYKYR